MNGCDAKGVPCVILGSGCGCLDDEGGSDAVLLERRSRDWDGRVGRVDWAFAKCPRTGNVASELVGEGREVERREDIQERERVETDDDWRWWW